MDEKRRRIECCHQNHMNMRVRRRIVSNVLLIIVRAVYRPNTCTHAHTYAHTHKRKHARTHISTRVTPIYAHVHIHRTLKIQYILSSYFVTYAEMIYRRVSADRTNPCSLECSCTSQRHPAAGFGCASETFLPTDPQQRYRPRWRW